MRFAIASLVMVGVALAACAQSPNDPSALPADEAHAIDAIARARGAQAGRCGGAPVDLEALRRETAAQIRPADCAGRIREHELETCVSEVDHAPCSADLTNVTRVSACDVGRICRYVSEGSV